MQLRISKSLSNIGEDTLIKNYIKNKCIYLTDKNKLEIKENKKKINKNDVLVKINECGICSSDLKFIYTGSRIKNYPIILGHEIAGTIGKNKHVVLVNGGNKLKKIQN